MAQEAKWAPLKESEARAYGFTLEHGGITRGDSSRRELALVFTADEFYEGLDVIGKTLRSERVKGAFFLTGRLYRNADAQPTIRRLFKEGHYMGPHSDMHLLYNDWGRRDSLLVSRDSMMTDLSANYRAMDALGIRHRERLFIPPYEWWSREVADWCLASGIQVVNFTAGTRSNADYTYPEMGTSYLSSDRILAHLESLAQSGRLQGAIILVHAGTDPRRPDKLYDRLGEWIHGMKTMGYSFKRLDEMIMR
jgi:peptidoglycan/xylan/chitin deacetylase (PgdA/CDA1 family)